MFSAPDAGALDSATGTLEDSLSRLEASLASVRAEPQLTPETQELQDAAHALVAVVDNASPNQRALLQANKESKTLQSR